MGRNFIVRDHIGYKFVNLLCFCRDRGTCQYGRSRRGRPQEAGRQCLRYHLARIGESLSHVCLCQVACEKKGRSHEVALISSSDGLPDFVKDR